MIKLVTEDKEVVSIKKKQLQEDQEKILVGGSNEFLLRRKRKRAKMEKLDGKYRLISKPINAIMFLVLVLL